MNVSELFEHVTRCGGDVRAIYTGTGNPEDRYAIIQDQNVWHVFYSERGRKLELCGFSTEDGACEYLLQLLQKDRTIWRMP